MRWLIILFFITMFFSESCSVSGQSSYCLTNGKCITVLYRPNNVVHIYAGKEFIDSTKSCSRITTNSTQMLTFYFSDSMPNKIIVRNEGNYNSINELQILNLNSKSNPIFIEFNDTIQHKLYQIGTQKFSDVRNEVDFLTLIIKEKYALDKKGQTIKPNQ